MVAAAVAIAGCAADDTAGDDTMKPGPTQVGGPATITPPTMPAMNGAIGGTGGSSGSSVGMQKPPVVANAMPCAVDTVVKSGCQNCHGATPIAGAPMALVSLADFQREYTAKTTTQMAGQTMKMYELARIRLNREMNTTPMPQGNPLAANDFGVLDEWLSNGAPAGSACTGAGTAGTGSEKPGGTGGNGATGLPSDVKTECDDPKSFEALVAHEGETCWEFQTHGFSSATDKTKFSIPDGETYNQFYFDVPWDPGSVSTRFGTDFDNEAVLHHWLAFSQALPTAHGTVSAGVSGTTLFEGAELIAGWAIGGCSTTYPEDVGVALPDSGSIMIQWHHYNSTGTRQEDGSKVQICTVPAGTRPNVAGLTFLGTETIAIPPGGPADATTSCQNNSGQPITIIGFTPHMHTIGSNMKSIVEKANGGGTVEVFNKPFVFNQQINYMLDTPYVLQPGDTVTTTCSWMNNTSLPISFGQSTTQEMCYQFTLAYPYGALNNGIFSLIGATNTCW